MASDETHPSYVIYHFSPTKTIILYLLDFYVKFDFALWQHLYLEGYFSYNKGLKPIEVEKTKDKHCFIKDSISILFAGKPSLNCSSSESVQIVGRYIRQLRDYKFQFIFWVLVVLYHSDHTPFLILYGFANPFSRDKKEHKDSSLIHLQIHYLLITLIVNFSIVLFSNNCYFMK